MQVDFFSDIHLENSKSKIFNIPPKSEYCIIAGDIGHYSHIILFLKQLSKKYKNIFLTLGNHDYYNSNYKNIKYNLEKILPKNIQLLKRGKTFQLGKYKIIGCTLWFKSDFSTSQKTLLTSLNEFKYIDGFSTSKLIEEGINDYNWIKSECDKDTIVVTHYLPSLKSINIKYKNNIKNVFYVNDCEDIIRLNKPKYWFHGHTHKSCDYFLGNTRILNNPRGYNDENESFDIKSIFL